MTWNNKYTHVVVVPLPSFERRLILGVLVILILIRVSSVKLNSTSYLRFLVVFIFNGLRSNYARLRVSNCLRNW